MATQLTQMELETDYLSCWLTGSYPKSDMKDRSKEIIKLGLQDKIQ